MEHRIVSREDWLAACKLHLAAEKELTRRRDALAAERRALPWVRVEKNYAFGRLGRPGHAGRPFRRQQPVDHLSLHVRAGSAGGMPKLLFSWLIISTEPTGT